ncbi:MAG TPA: type VI secretion system-associated protein TagF [Steroidobacteraceae bacterium]|nr:type VI secretion system-associated protein TagF [Steroidobacteraceae bacterium]
MDVGLYGKLPTHGDFLRRRVADDFLAAWDPWLQQCIASSRAVLGERWLSIYLTSPVWRFALGPNVCGAAPAAGLLVPSVDRVGRYFPLTLVWTTPTELSTFEVALRFQRGFERAERLLLDTLALEQFEFAELDRRVMELADNLVQCAPASALRLTRDSATAVALSPDRSWCIPLAGASALEGPAVQLFGCQQEARSHGVGLWWTDGSAVVAPSWLITQGLPDPSSYTAMLDGEWAAAGWGVAEAESDFSQTIVRDDVPHIATVTASAARTDRGPVRTSNQDAFIERPDMGLWAVADGMGGLRDGDLASRMVCDSLADLSIAAGLDEQIEGVVEQLRRVNEYLRQAATRAVNPVQSGSTVLVLLIRQSEWAILWAGDSRGYRLRDGALSQLTTDHSWAAHGGADEQAITRAVGAEDSLELEVVRGDVRGGDRYLLCSDGVGRVLDTEVLRELLATLEPAACCSELIAQSIVRGGTDNMTAVVVDCGASSGPQAPGGGD